MAYNFWTGLEKTLKNVFVMALLPGIEYAVSNIANWNVPGQYQVPIALACAAIGYGIKNYITNKTQKVSTNTTPANQPIPTPQTQSVPATQTTDPNTPK